MLEILKKCGVEDTIANEIVKAMGEAKVYTTKLENIDVRYEKLKDKNKQLEESNKNYESKVNELSKSNKDNSELMAQIEQLQLSNKELEDKHTKELYERDFNSALDKTLDSAKSKNNKALRGLLDFDSIKYQDGKLEGLESQIESLKKSDPYLFEVDKPVNTGGVGAFSRGGTNPIATNPKEEFKKMNMAQRLKLRAENPVLYREITETN